MKANIGSFVVMIWMIFTAIHVLFRNRRYLMMLPKEERKESFRSMLTKAFADALYGDATYENERSNQ